MRHARRKKGGWRIFTFTAARWKGPQNEWKEVEFESFSLLRKAIDGD